MDFLGCEMSRIRFGFPFAGSGDVNETNDSSPPNSSMYAASRTLWMGFLVVSSSFSWCWLEELSSSIKRTISNLSFDFSSSYLWDFF